MKQRFPKNDRKNVLKKTFPHFISTMQLTKPSDVRKESVIFCEPKTDKHGNESIKIQTKYPNNKAGPLVIASPFLFSFGVNERKMQETGEIVGYTLPVCLWGKDEEPTPEQREFFECLTKLQDLCYEYLNETYDGDEVCGAVDEVERLSDLLYYKQTTDKKGRKKRDESAPPILYAKLMYSGKNDKILSLFRTKGDDRVDPMMYFEKYCTVKLALVVESIYIGENSVSIQMKVSECYVKPQRKIEPMLTIEDSDDEE